MMNKFTIAIAALLFLGAWACKTSKISESVALSKPQNLDKALLWEITVKGIAQPSYIYGTIHMIPAEDYFLPKGTLGAIENCDEMFFEIDMKDMTDMGAMMGMMNKIFMKDGVTLKDLITEEEYKKVSAKFSEMGLPMMMLDRIKPMFLSAFAMADMNPNSMKEGKIKSYEMEFYNLAQNKKMTTGGLETIDFQIGVFDSIPYKDQAKMLVESINEDNTEDAEFQEMIKMYKDQNIDAMVEMMHNGSSDLGAHEDLLLTGRNKNWIEKIITQAKKKPTFFAVGAGHLGGKDGVIALLRKNGLQVKAVSK
jgi:uncharacterized protein